MKLKHGSGYLDLDTDSIGKHEILMNNFKAKFNPLCVIKNALENPIDSLRLSEIVKKGDKICIVISDVTRAYQKMNFWLPYIVEEITSTGVKDKDIVFLSANGAHRKQTSKEHEMILGIDLSKRFKIIDHDCFDEEQLVYLGKTSRGTEIKINKKAVEYDHLILTGAVTFHDMAGYGGGRKSILPGISSYRGVMDNHSRVLSENEGHGIHISCRMGNIEGNPMHLDMIEACEKINISFTFNVILDSSGNIYKAVAGDYKMVHKIGRNYCDDTGVVYINQKADIVIASAGGYPKDMNLYQVSKAHSACAEALKTGGDMIIVAECIENMGSDESIDIIMNYENNLEREMKLRKKFSPEEYSGYLLCELATKYNIIMVSKYENEAEISKSGMKLFRNLDNAVRSIYKDKTDTLTYIIPNAMATLPKIRI